MRPPLERLRWLWIMLASAGAVLGLRLVQMQIVQAGEYRLAAERNRSQLIHQNAPRGRLFDRRGAAIAANAPAFSLIFFSGKERRREDLAALAGELSRQLGRPAEEILERLQQAAREESAVRLAENLPAPAMFRLSELKTVYPGIDLIVEARRHYPFGRFASHLVGYMGKMTASEWRERKGRGYRADARVGRLGLERVFESELRGQDGGIRMEVDAQGRLKRMLERIPWKAGSNIHLTLDAMVQKAADEGLRASPTGRGAAVAVDPRNGDLLALSSAPDFDLNAFLSTDPGEAQRTVADLNEYNLAIAGTYPPGSTFKPFVGLAGLSEGRVDDREEVYCPGYYDLGPRTFLCWEEKGHRRLSWLMALARSCDVYFYTMGRRLGGGTMERTARAFGLGAKTNLALPGERAGHVFGPEERRRSGKGWYDGDSLNLAIGQGELLVTPVQMAVAASALANRGTLWRPHYTSRIEYSDGRPDYEQRPEKRGRVEAPERAWDLVQEAMQLAVSSGTGTGARIPGLVVAGKTGTAQNPHGEDHSWFIAYAARPGEPASIALAVIVENGGHGSTGAVPVARRMLLAQFGMEDPARPSSRALPPGEASRRVL